MNPRPAAGPGLRWPCLSAHGGGTLLQIVVSPNARRSGADGLHDGALRVRLAAPPVDGKANAALLAWLAGELELPRQALQLQRGELARRKGVQVSVAPERVAAWLDRVLAAP